MVGKRKRLKRIFRNDLSLVVPMDHGITKPEAGLERIDFLLERLDGLADAFVLHKGVVKHSKYVEEMESALIIHLSASTSLSPDPNAKTIVTSVKKAVELGADAVSVHINVGSETEERQLKDVGMIAEEADEYGMPLLVMSYPRGRGVDERKVENVMHAARVAYELGADIIKTNYTGSAESFSKVVEIVDVPVLIAGGSKKSFESFLMDVRNAIRAGARGVAAGRNVFQAEDPRGVVLAIKSAFKEALIGVER
ncbi:2-amino-3,7-dideoxy-D-threo-hept-6-ulosonate synthase [Ferroglobus sp.]|uniref:2-amino-3,7-dideoxy-D-threo-hept-6-ulosonate synthase n=1 Tax=Ferroglobus sp. TaxID=2614230 RepID=UPI0025BAABEB|nr:2-amino-3,7-dideoxy-D-threo-hept-6-ulosonate synthase [Ferroglobus sp.]